jgi:antitoxin ParD1/3/4
VVFCDGHVESPTLPFLFTDTSAAALSRWNRDHQSHRERLSPYFICYSPVLDATAKLTFISAMTVTLTAEQEQFITEQLKDGHYRSAADVVAQSLGILRAQEEFIRSNIVELREKIAVGIEQSNRGELLDGKAVIDALLEKNRRRPRP